MGILKNMDCKKLAKEMKEDRKRERRQDLKGVALIMTALLVAVSLSTLISVRAWNTMVAPTLHISTISPLRTELVVVAVFLIAFVALVRISKR